MAVDFAGDAAGLLREADVAGELAGGLIGGGSAARATRPGGRGRRETRRAGELADAVGAAGVVNALVASETVLVTSCAELAAISPVAVFAVRIAGEFDARLVDVPAGAGGEQVADDDFRVGDVDRGVRRPNVGGDFARAVDLPVAGGEPRPGASEPAGDAAGRVNGDRPDGVGVVSPTAPMSRASS